MGVYTEYLDRKLDFGDLQKERQAQLARISQLRGGHDVLVYASDLTKGNQGAPVAIDYSDLLPINDQLANLGGSAIDVVIETPGGDGTVAEDIVRILRAKYQHVSFIIPGYAKSAGTIMAMAGNEILMGPTSALGPIDAQLLWQGKTFSAEALLKGLQNIKDEVVTTGVLNKAYIPILQNISPGELEHARNALDFAKKLVNAWLAKYKFADWTVHASTGNPVTLDERTERAREIAEELCSHTKWLSHGRSIRIDDLHGMRLRVTDYAQYPELADAIGRYHTLLQMTLNGSSVYKVIETPKSQIYRFAAPQVAAGGSNPGVARAAIVQVKCAKCATVSELQANLEVAQPLQAGKIPFPSDNRLKCPKCGDETDLAAMRQQIESQTGKKVV